MRNLHVGPVAACRRRRELAEEVLQLVRVAADNFPKLLLVREVERVETRGVGVKVEVGRERTEEGLEGRKVLLRGRRDGEWRTRDDRLDCTDRRLWKRASARLRNAPTAVRTSSSGSSLSI